MAKSDEDIENLINIIKSIAALDNPNDDLVLKTIWKYPSSEGRLFSKSEVLKAFRDNKGTTTLNIPSDEQKKFLKAIRMKKIRTLSGVTPVTVLTKPFPCPGKCIFCPNDVRMPKSYVSSEPGAQRAYRNKFDPYFQTYNRLVAYHDIGHPTSKVELIVLGGTWTSYPEAYRIWFIKRCFDALNDFGKIKTPELLDPAKLDKPISDAVLTEEETKLNASLTYNQIVSLAIEDIDSSGEKASWKELFESHRVNETAESRCVGLSIETRPDEISEQSVIEMRKLGATKVQIGVQSLNDEVLSLNKRGHDVETTKSAFRLLRQAGFKIHAHWMPNLYGSTPAKDKDDFKKLFEDAAFRPDELKIYPCSLIVTAELMDYHKAGKWRPYTEKELLDVMKNVLPKVPRYCRITRVIRDIPSEDIVEGNKKTNFRQIAQDALIKDGTTMHDIRAREIREKEINKENLQLKITEYETLVSKEYFLEYVTPDDKIVGFLRLSLPTKENYIDELKGKALIREIHVYGQSLDIGSVRDDKAQHLGLGKKLMEEAKHISKRRGCKGLAVISSVGTREYYRNNGFNDISLYQYVKC